MVHEQFQEEYTRALADFVAAPRQLLPCRAVQLGQKASAGGLSASTILNVHHGAVQRIQTHECVSADAVSRQEQLAISISIFFRESLAAYEAANQQLTRENVTLLQINDALELQASRIAQGLHDDAGQLLTVAHLKLAKAEETASPQCREHLVEIRALFDKMEQQLRRFSHELHPAVLIDFGLVSALEFFVQGIVEREGLKIRIEGTLGLSVLEPLEIVLYRFVQEALTNVIRHARATNAMVRFEQTAEELACMVVDDGVGFFADKYRSGMGISAMGWRMRAVGGQLSVTSSPGCGAEVSARIPMKRVS